MLRLQALLFSEPKPGLCSFIVEGYTHRELLWRSSDCLFLPRIQTCAEPQEPLQENLTSSSSLLLPASEEAA